MEVKQQPNYCEQLKKLRGDIPAYLANYSFRELERIYSDYHAILMASYKTVPEHHTVDLRGGDTRKKIANAQQADKTKLRDEYNSVSADVQFDIETLIGILGC